MFNDLIKRRSKNFNAKAICPRCSLEWTIEFRNFNDRKDVFHYFKSKCNCGESLILKNVNEGKNFHNNMRIFK